MADLNPFKFVFNTIGLLAGPEATAATIGLQLLTQQLNEYSQQQAKKVSELELQLLAMKEKISAIKGIES